MTKFILIVWLGSGNTQTFSMEKFDTAAECEAAKTSVNRFVGNRWFMQVECLPYTFEE